jgi:2-polyprenyl-3-methyl-5-hydroxy-6-metoxy-1,4-benzoquinol methylase
VRGMSEIPDYSYSSATCASGACGALVADKIVKLLSKLPPSASICDLGSGNGYLAARLMKDGYDVVGVDSSQSGIDLAQRAYGNGAKFLCAQIDASLPQKLAGARFNAVVSSDVIEHLYRPRDLLECAYDLLVPDGWLIVGTPYHGYLKNLAISVLDRWDVHHAVDWDGGHIKFFSVNTLAEMVTSSGFELERCYFVGRVWGLWKNMLCVARKSTGATGRRLS